MSERQSPPSLDEMIVVASERISGVPGCNDGMSSDELARSLRDLDHEVARRFVDPQWINNIGAANLLVDLENSEARQITLAGRWFGNQPLLTDTATLDHSCAQRAHLLALGRSLRELSSIAHSLDAANALPSCGVIRAISQLAVDCNVQVTRDREVVRQVRLVDAQLQIHSERTTPWINQSDLVLVADVASLLAAVHYFLVPELTEGEAAAQLLQLVASAEGGSGYIQRLAMFAPLAATEAEVELLQAFRELRSNFAMLTNAH